MGNVVSCLDSNSWYGERWKERRRGGRRRKEEMVFRLVFARIQLMSAYTTFYLRHRTNAKHSVEGHVITRREFTGTHNLPVSSYPYCSPFPIACPVPMTLRPKSPKRIRRLRSSDDLSTTPFRRFAACASSPSFSLIPTLSNIDREDYLWARRRKRIVQNNRF